MQSSYSVIKKKCTLDGEKKKIATEYCMVNKVEKIDEEIIEETEENLSKDDLEKLLKRYEEIGQKIIRDGNNEKQAIILKATMQAQNLEKEGYQKGYDQGIKNGYDDGYKKAFDENIELGKAKAQEIINTAEELLSSANENYAKYLEDKKSEVINLSLEIAKSILKKELNHEDSMNLIIEQAIELSKGEENIILRCNSMHVEELKTQVQRWKIAYSIKDQIFILNDDFMEPGNAVLEKPSGKVMVGIDIGMEQIKKELLG
ncbi:FliH/SctL family protein [Clostridium uliginosum]|uniref:Flagellar assembly protein FliH n=1 Tax=Clostridium uliginosum TaxID=119641 RepID=A0A1I1KLJ6_9CLOT|nr:FliH/SctL family protein [Clostridium uliginosum]SFC61132.1 flagellar assembly protein FliH [Clostridium uliginosum]